MSKSLIFDLGGLEFIDSSGLAVLLTSSEGTVGPAAQPFPNRSSGRGGHRALRRRYRRNHEGWLPLDATGPSSERDCRLFAGVQASVTSARRFVVEALWQIPKPLLEAIELMVSELASNCVLHTSAEFVVCIVRAERMVRVEVTDTGRGLPGTSPTGVRRPQRTGAGNRQRTGR